MLMHLRSLSALIPMGIVKKLTYNSFRAYKKNVTKLCSIVCWTQKKTRKFKIQNCQIDT